MGPQHRLQTSQYAAWNQVLQELKSQVIQPALSKAGVKEPVSWTCMRWDAVDIMAAWPKDDTERNVHAWLTGDWPNYTVNFEGAAWQDDEKNLKRRVLFFGGPRGLVQLDPPWEHPKVGIIDRDNLLTGVEQLAECVQRADVGQQPWEYALEPDPREGSEREVSQEW